MLTHIIRVLLCAIVLIASPIHLFAFPEKTDIILTGKITDKLSGITLPGVSIYIPELKTGTVSKADGTYEIMNLPSAKVIVQVSLIGYKTILETIDLTASSVYDFTLEPSVTEMNEIVITGLSNGAEKNRVPTPMTIVSQNYLLQNASVNIIDALAKQPGVSQITNGPGISKPIIRGLGFNRVVLVNDGIRQEGQQWGGEHGIEIDEFSVDKVEILKGPASIAYGSDAMAGVINMLTAPTLPVGTIKGNLIANYQTNNGLLGYSANISGNHKGIIFSARYSNKNAYAYQNKADGYVLNTSYKENNASAIIGINKSWGYSHLHVSSYNLTLGIAEGERDSITGKFIREVKINDTTSMLEIPSDNVLQSYSIGIPFQKINHNKVVLNNNFLLKKGSLKAIIGFQQNARKEFADIFHPDEYELSFLLNTINYDLRYLFPEKNNWNISLGVNGMSQTSSNKGVEFLIPEYRLTDAGTFVIARKSYNKLDISGGVRYDSRLQSVKSLYLNNLEKPVDVLDTSAYIKFSGFNTTFSGVSGSIGLAYQFSEKLYGKLNASRGYRAPNISELASNGVHEGSLRYEIGNSQLKPETSLQLDVAIGVNTEHASAELTVFNNNITDYVFLQKLNSFNGNDSIMEGVSAFSFVSGNARLTGGEISVDIHPHPIHWLHFENSFSMVNATQLNQPDSTSFLPFIPAPKLQMELRADIKKVKNSIDDAYFKVELENYLEQNRYYSAYSTETKTPAYTLINIGFGGNVLHKQKTLFSLFVSANNLANTIYQSHLSQLKYAPYNYANQRAGIFNMGRNISFKISVPLDFKS